MPARGKLHRERSAFLKFKTELLNTPYLGIPGLVDFIDVRTQWFDSGVKRAITDGITQVVIIAAGYDTRAYRLGKPGVKFYEIDLPHASETKQELVKKHMPASKYIWPEFIGADLSKVTLMDALSRSSWDSSRRTMFIIEGLVYYLPPQAFKKSLTGISETAVAGSRLFFDFLHLDALSNEIVMPGLETLLVAVWNKGEMMYSGIDHRPEALRSLLKKFGFRLHEVLDARGITRRHHPHVQGWSALQPHVAPFFGYVAAEKVQAPLKRQETVTK
ncbi:S-adenosyl-L-methionine-dependent methyltransferase [Scenedesmus sp. NREL 46B-D3]|nr:S-adenosyl-L-methionine-dependent methyltransferase [Scenedesmus sp. NREL 46B-D3]